MSVLTSKKRNKLKESSFGIPSERKYPMPDKSHAVNAKARATQMVNKGKLSQSEKEMIDRKANAILSKGRHRSIEKHAERVSIKDGHHDGKVTKHKHVHEHVHHHTHKETKHKETKHKEHKGKKY